MELVYSRIDGTCNYQFDKVVKIRFLGKMDSIKAGLYFKDR